MEGIDKITIFSNELNDIKDGKLRDFAEILISHADDYFFRIPASTTGKYHPQFDLGEGGLVRHTKCVEYFAKCMAESLDFNQHDTDLLIIAALVHDIKKLGDGKSKYTVRNHPILAGEYVANISKEYFHNELISDNDVNKIIGAVNSHMGKWEHNQEFLKKNAKPLPMPSNDFEKALQAADYVASRKEILDFKFRDNNYNMPEKYLVKEEEDPSEYILTFGKYKGKMLKDVDINYLNWMINNGTFSHVVIDKVKKYLNTLK